MRLLAYGCTSDVVQVNIGVKEGNGRLTMLANYRWLDVFG